jgi:hypothetical protein
MNKKIAYICAPYAADEKHTIEQHIEIATQYAKRVSSPQIVAFVPHLCFPHASDQFDRDAIMDFLVSIVPDCQEIHVVGEHISSGMDIEIQCAMNNYVPIIWDHYLAIRQWNEDHEDEIPEGEE